MIQTAPQLDLISARSIPKRWRDLFDLLPGYDPRRTTLGKDCKFDEFRAEHVCEFFATSLVHVEGHLAGEPFVLEPWQQAYVGALFGFMQYSKRWKKWLRRYRRSLLYLPRKNGKTSKVSGLSVYVPLCDRESGAKCYALAGDRDQARLLFEPAKAMIRANPALEKRARILRQSIIFNGENTLQVVSSDAGNKHGYRTHFAAFDELHVQKTRDLYDAIDTSTGSRLNPLVVFITTADEDRPSICNEVYEYACRVRDGVVDDPSFFPCIYEADRDDDPFDVAVWEKANPNLGVSLTYEYMHDAARKAKESPTFLAAFKRYHLNMRVQSAEPWIDLGYWDRCRVSKLPPLETIRDRPVFAGMDLSAREDLTSVVYLVQGDDGDVWLYPRFWMPSETLRKRSTKTKIPWSAWVKTGHLRVTEGEVIDYRAILDDIVSVSKSCDLREVGFDPWNATHLSTLLEEEHGVRMVQVSQGVKGISAAAIDFHAAVVAGKVKHESSPVMRWCAANAKAKADSNGNIRLDKAKSADRIDGIAAAVTGWARSMVNVERASVYETRGALCF